MKSINTFQFIVDPAILATLLQIHCATRYINNTPSHSPFCLDQQILNICSGSLKWITLISLMHRSFFFLPSGPSSVWWWSSVRSSWEENTESASSPPPPTGCTKAPSNYPGCIYACHLLAVHKDGWRRRSALRQVSLFNINVNGADLCSLYLHLELLPPGVVNEEWETVFPHGLLGLEPDLYRQTGLLVVSTWEQPIKNLINLESIEEPEALITYNSKY